MNAATSDAERAVSSQRRRYKHRVLLQADGSRFVLNANGSIDHAPADGGETRSWSPVDSEWAGQALRFGVQPDVPTLTPSGRNIADLEPRR